MKTISRKKSAYHMGRRISNGSYVRNKKDRETAIATLPAHHCLAEPGEIVHAPCLHFNIFCAKWEPSKQAACGPVKTPVAYEYAVAL